MAKKSSNESEPAGKGKSAGKKDKKAKKGKKGKKGGPSVATHPRAAASVRRAKGFGGLMGFALAALLSYRAGLGSAQVLERALVVGVGGYLLAWACAVAVWRSLLLAELRSLVESHEQLRAARPQVPLIGSSEQPETAPAELAAAGE